MNRLLFCLLLAAVVPAQAQIYRYTDANGNTVFTNQPPTDAASQEVNLQQANRIPSVTNNATVNPTASPDAVASAPYETLALSGIPDDDAAIRANNGDFTVDVSIQPPLASGHQLRLILDGQPYGQASRKTRFNLTNINRGEHSLSVAVIDSQGQTVQESPADTFTVQRISLHSPARAR